MTVTVETKRMKIPKQEYTAGFKELAVKRVKNGSSVGVVAKDLGPVEQTLPNWVKAAAAGGEHPAQARERNPKRSDGVLRQGRAVKYA